MRRPGTYAVYLILTTAAAFFFSTAFAASGLYRFQMAGLGPLQLVLVGTALELSAFLFEIPTGIVADLYSRRLSVIVGYAIIGMGFILEGAFTWFATIVLAQVIWGLGYTFTSGALDAWLADELGEDRLAATYLRGTQLAQIAGLLGLLSGALLAGIRLNIPFLVGGAGMVALAVYLVTAMEEHNFTPTPRGERTTWQSMGHTFQQGFGFIRRSPLLLTILALALISGLSSEGLDRLWEAHLLTNFTLPGPPSITVVYWFVGIKGVVTVLTIALTEVMRRRAEQFNHRQAVWLLLVLTGILAGGLLLFGLANRVTVAIAAYIVLSVARSTSGPIFSAWINRGIEPRVRATVLSTIGQMDAIGQVVGGPPVGAIGVRYGLRAAMVAIGLLLTPALALYGRALGQEPQLLKQD
ncbi:MAG: MFS transporter [Caldilineaceae bacterium]|nr:MFS transporter [Caldilineaceae bacterium]